MTKPVRSSPAINRREALSRIALLMGGALVGAEAILGCKRRADDAPPVSTFSAREVDLMDEIGEAIIPTTDTPGAKAAGISAFMAMVVEECYEEVDQRLFRDGLEQVDLASRERFGRKFLAASRKQRSDLIAELDTAESARRRAGEPHGYFTLMKQLTILGYFTSEIGCTQALRFQETPGSYNGCAPFEPDDRAWFGNVGRSFKVGS